MSVFLKDQDLLESLRKALDKWKCEKCSMNLNEFYSSICHICHQRDANIERNALRDEMFRLEANVNSAREAE